MPILPSFNHLQLGMVSHVPILAITLVNSKEIFSHLLRPGVRMLRTIYRFRSAVRWSVAVVGATLVAAIPTRLADHDSAIGFPFTWHTAQEIVFEKSISGPVIKQYFGFFLIKPTLPEDTTFHQREADFADK